MDNEEYRNDLAAALVHIEQLEHELLLFRSDPAYERVDIAEEQLDAALRRRARARKLLPQILIASFALMGTFALTDPSLPMLLRIVGCALSAFGVASTVASIVALLLVQRARTAKLEELERHVRIAKGDVGTRLLVAPAPIEDGQGEAAEANVVRRLA